MCFETEKLYKKGNRLDNVEINKKSRIVPSKIGVVKENKDENHTTSKIKNVLVKQVVV